MALFPTCVHVCVSGKVCPSFPRQPSVAVQTLPGLSLFHSSWLRDAFSLWLWCLWLDCDQGCEEARPSSGSPWLQGLLQAAMPSQARQLQAAPVLTVGTSSVDYAVGETPTPTPRKGSLPRAIREVARDTRAKHCQGLMLQCLTQMRKFLSLRLAFSGFPS